MKAIHFIHAIKYFKSYLDKPVSMFMSYNHLSMCYLLEYFLFLVALSILLLASREYWSKTKHQSNGK